MIKATATVNGKTDTKFFDSIGHAIQWIRGLWDATEWRVYDEYGKLYYTI